MVICRKSDLRRLFGVAIVVGVAMLLYLSLPASASTYGSSAYDTCYYQTDCPQPSTPITTPSGLKVSINLTNGQQIPVHGYTIIITPLNGQGRSFKKADIYINGRLAHSAAPGKTGTVQWLWIPGGSLVTCLAFDPSASATQIGSPGIDWW